MLLTYENCPKNLDSLVELLHQEGELSVDFKLCNKRKLKRAFDLIKESEIALRRKGTLLGRIYYWVVSIKLFYYQSIIGGSDPGVSLSLLICTTAGKHIAYIAGKDISNTHGRVTFEIHK